ncbi:MAG: carboxypeptidase M32 [Candidatus Latescibacterota bacterium]
MNGSRAYEEFLRLAAELADLEHAEALLGWDQEVCMPAPGTPTRAQSAGTLAGIRHERLTAPALVALVERLGEQDLDPDAAANVRELARVQRRARRLPRELVVERARTQSLAHQAWVEARRQARFADFAPWLDKIVALRRREAECVGYEGSPYNALLDEYEPHARAEEIGPLFARLRRRLVPLVERVAATGRHPGRGILDQEYPVDRQEALVRRILQDFGFDLQAGRLDVAAHPFCASIGRGDVRLTTRYSASHLPTALFGAIHEAGHGLYEQGLPAELAGQPAGGSISLGIHESQSRLWENIVGRSRPFWEHYLAVLQQAFPRQLGGVSVEAFYAAVNQVEPSLIRVEADEVTYSLHILLRFELEKDLLEGRLAVADLPESWNARLEEYLGIRPPNDADGVLQDVHWSVGLIGYFPTYTLGNLYAAQFYRQACREIPDLPEQIRQGRLLGLKGWLNERIHRHGRRLTAAQLVQAVTGEPLQAEVFLDYLEAKFGEVYGLGPARPSPSRA